ncbi:hypothetical protein G6F50_013587 [Rhizopus delemar]|uniref:Uncharacterized protein n=1 Tax=Rhizopus delemar TaxID=936053 RepID=A0A9P6YG00_9FUNG|nr:hypothetical protein G6F50_013587 [Rhizopus delemar]
MRLRGRPTRLVGQHAGAAFQLQRSAVAIQVVARGRAEAQQQGVAVAGDGIEAEGLFRRQRQRLAVAGRARQAQAARAAGTGQRIVERVAGTGTRRGCRSLRTAARQGDLHHALLRRVADAGIGATLVAHFHADGAGRIGGCAGQGGLQALAIGFNLAEEIVVVPVALGHLQRAGVERRVRLDAGAVAIQVIARRDLELQLQLATFGGGGGQRERLVHRQQVLLIQREGRQREPQQGAQGGATRKQSLQSVSSRVCARIQSRYAGRPARVSTAMHSGSSYGCSSTIRAIASSTRLAVVFTSSCSSLSVGTSPAQR